MTCGTWYWFDHCLCLQQFPHICLVTTLSSASWCVTVGLHFHHTTAAAPCPDYLLLSSSVAPTLAHVWSGRGVAKLKLKRYWCRYNLFLQFFLLEFELLIRKIQIYSTTIQLADNYFHSFDDFHQTQIIETKISDLEQTFFAMLSDNNSWWTSLI